MTEYTWEMLLEQIENDIVAGQTFPIATEDRMFLICDQEPKGRQFAELFQQVWQQIAEDVRLVIIEFWKQHAIFGRPIIEYSNLWEPRESGVRATTSAFAGEMQFLAKELDPMPDDAVQFIIAHELAHVFQKARGDRLKSVDRTKTSYIGSDGRRRTVEENEYDADNLAESWGFSQRPLQLYDLKNNRVRVRHRDVQINGDLRSQ